MLISAAAAYGLRSGSGLADRPGPPAFQGRRKPFTLLEPVRNAPNLPMHRASGGVANLASYRGRVVLLNLWATWCAACLHELPALDRLAKSMGGNDFDVVTLNLDEGGIEPARALFARLDIRNLPLLFDPAGRFPAALDVYDGLPWSFVIDRSGRVRGYVAGAADWDTPRARALLDHYIAKEP